MPLPASSVSSCQQVKVVCTERVSDRCTHFQSSLPIKPRFESQKQKEIWHTEWLDARNRNIPLRNTKFNHPPQELKLVNKLGISSHKYMTPRTRTKILNRLQLLAKFTYQLKHCNFVPPSILQYFYPTSKLYL